MTQFAKNLFWALFKVIGMFVPKNKRLVVFCSDPDFTDNARALYEYLKVNCPAKYILRWLVESQTMVSRLDSLGVSVCKRKSIAGMISILRAKYFVTTHSYPARLKGRSQVLIDVWHGMPLKAMGFVDPGGIADLNRLRRISESTDYLIATSIIMRNALVACFHIDPRKVRVTGQPRNDRLVEGAEAARQRLERLIGFGVGGKKVAMWVPTYHVGASRVDGEDIGDLLGLDSLRLLSEFLVSRDLILVIKLHPQEKFRIPSKSLPGIAWLTEESLRQELADLSDVLGAADALITDYSSTYFDFLLLNRPVVFCCPDLPRYRQERGFVLEPFEFWAPGPKVSTISQLAAELDRLLLDPQYFAAERATVNALVNYHQDGRSSERVSHLLDERAFK